MERRRRKFEEHVKIMDAERLVKISRDKVPVGRFPGRPKIRWVKQTEKPVTGRRR